MRAKTTLGAIWNHKCPRCRNGRLFDSGSFSFRKPFEMKSGCDQCGQTYYPEPGFYYGAMFMSYIITSFFSLGLVGFCILVLDWSVNGSFVFLLIVIGLLYVWFCRTARSVWLSMNVKYDPRAIEKAKEAGFDPEAPDFVNKNF